MGVYCCPLIVCPRLFANLKDLGNRKGSSNTSAIKLSYPRLASCLDYEGNCARMMKNELSLKSGFLKKGSSVEGELCPGDVLMLFSASASSAVSTFGGNSPREDAAAKPREMTRKGVERWLEKRKSFR